ncbi:uncharacterized protein LOC101745403 [Bombyx mori]|uniref:Uncharacterized protein n=1 Tax=Bombyx mori TaxID=7091 RepID=A0A8R1WP61_BOMMO|nr:uncharacterized protein LOC101745403 [Bombyx mori]
MDRARRNRRGRYQSQNNSTADQYNTRTTKPWSFLSGFYSFMIMCCLLSVIYLMLEYHCHTCNTKCDLNGITRNINDISRNLSLMKNNYEDLEIKLSKFSQELPKLEGQMEILEALANTVETKDFGWNPNSPLLLNAERIQTHSVFDSGNFSKVAKQNIFKPDLGID